MTGPMVVAFTVWNRPDYLRQVLAAWSTVRGIDKAVLQFHCEPGCGEVIQLCKEVGFADRQVHVNPAQLGAAANTKQALDGGCETSDYVVLATDDFLPADDTLDLHAWHRDNYATDPTVLALSCWRGDPTEGGPAAVWRTQTIGWLHGFHRDKWALVSPLWDANQAHPGFWYLWIDEYFCQTRGYDILRPALSRAQDIGETGYQPLPGPFSQIQSPSFRPHYDPQHYREVPGRRERGILSTWIEDYWP